MIKGWSHSCWVPEGPFWQLMFLKTRDGALNNPSCCVSPLNMHAWGVRQMNVNYLLLRGQNKAIQRFQWRSSVWTSHDKNTRGLAHDSGIQDKQDTRTANLWLHQYFASIFVCLSVDSCLCFHKLLIHQLGESNKPFFLWCCLHLLSFYSTVSSFVFNNEMGGWSWL